MEPQLHEMVDLTRVDAVIIGLAVVAPLLGLVVGALWGRLHGTLGGGLLRGVLFGMLGPVVLVMWRLYSYMVRYDPETGYVGLHRMSVLLVNVALFALVGVLLGIVYGKLVGCGRQPQRTQPEDHLETEESQS